MHMGGGFSKLAARSLEPSAAGHGVSPVIAAPGMVLGATRVVAAGSVVSVESDASTVLSSSWPMRRDSPKAAASATTTMRPMRIDLLAGGAAPLLALQLGQAGLAVGLLSFPFVGAHGGGRLPMARPARASAPAAGRARTRARRGGKGPGPGRAGRYRVVPVALIVQKYGGTSVADADRIKAVAEHVAFTRRPGPRPGGGGLGAWARRPTTSSPWPTRCRPPSPAGRWTCCSPSASARAWRSLCMALADLGVDAVSLHRQPGRHHHRQRPRQGQDPRGQGRPGPGRPGRRARCAWWPASRACRPRRRSPRWAGAASDLTAVALAAAFGADSCEIYTDVTGRLLRRSPHRAAGPQAGQDPLRRDAGDGRRRWPGAGAALGRVRPQPRRRPARALQLHLGAGHLGQQRGRRAWKTRSSPA